MNQQVNRMRFPMNVLSATDAPSRILKLRGDSQFGIATLLKSVVVRRGGSSPVRVGFWGNAVGSSSRLITLTPQVRFLLPPRLVLGVHCHKLPDHAIVEVAQRLLLIAGDSGFDSRSMTK